MKVSVLGTEYTIITKNYEEDEIFERRSICAYCDGYTKEIVLCDLHTYKGWEYESEATIAACQKETLRHEIVHAFFNESGLMDSAFRTECAWSKNEEMIDWLAIQIPKIYKAFEEAGCI